MHRKLAFTDQLPGDVTDFQGRKVLKKTFQQKMIASVNKIECLDRGVLSLTPPTKYP